MSGFDPLIWELQFKLQNQGADVSKAAELLKTVETQAQKTGNTIVNLNVKFSQLNKTINDNRTKISNRFSGLGSGNGSFGGGITNASAASGSGMSGILSSLSSGAASAAAAIGLIAVAVDKVYGAMDQFTGRMVEVFAERQSSLRAYTSILGDATEAEKQYFKEAALAQKTELTQTDVRGFSSRLITSGFRGEDLERARLNVADLVTSRPEHQRATSSNQLAELYSKVNGLGYISNGLLNRTASRFVNNQFINEEIGTRLGIKPNQVEDAAKNRKVTKEVFFDAFQAASLKQLGTGKIGQFALAGNNSLGGLLSNQEEASTNLMRSVDPDTLYGVSLYKKSISELTDTMSYSTKTGNDLRYVLEEASNVGTSLRAAGNTLKNSFLISFGDSFRKKDQELGNSSEETQVVMEGLIGRSKTFGEFLGDKLAKGLAYALQAFKSISVGIDMVGIGVKAAIREISNFVIQIQTGFENITGVVKTFFDMMGSYIVGTIFKIIGKITFNKDMQDQGNAFLNNANMDKFKWKDAVTDKGTLSQDIENYTNNMVKREDELRAANEAAAKNAKNGKDKNGNPLPPDNENAGGGRGKGGGGGGKDNSGILLGFDYDRKLPAIPIGMMMSNFQGAGKAMDITPSSLQFASNAQPLKVVVEHIHINIQGSDESPQDIADQIYTKFSQQVGRLVRSPSSQSI